jgi:geranylgeranyl diphosphate synthase type II
VLELYHNAFLIHDDVEDFSELRRDLPTLPEMYGVPIAVNVGDAMLALALSPLLDNMRSIGMGKALRILEAVAVMARESAEGQAIELEWIRTHDFDRGDADYVAMVEKKTSHYSFIAPGVIGGILGGADAALLAAIERFFRPLGVAFQIQDDLLNLTGDYGKEARGDLWEGKHTLILMHAMRQASSRERRRAAEILKKPRPRVADTKRREGAAKVVEELASAGQISRAAKEAILAAIAGDRAEGVKTQEDIDFLGKLIDTYGSIEYARGAARRWASETGAAFEAVRSALKPSVHRDFLGGLVDYVVNRSR